MSSRSRVILTLLVGASLGALITVTGQVVAERAPTPAAAPLAKTTTARAAVLPWADARIMAEVLQRVRENYVDSVGDHDLLQNATRGMVESLDDHSTVLDRDEYAEMKVSTSGSYAGIGVEVQAVDGQVHVVRRMPGSPAERAGILPGDAIVKIDGMPLNPDDLDTAINRMRGPVGSSVHLAVRRNEQTLEISVQRAEVALQSVAAQFVAPGYGYARIASFTDTTAEELQDAIEKMQQQQDFKGLLIDLRDNPGGVLEAAVDAADEFLDGGLVVSAEGRTPDATFRMDAQPGDILSGAPIVLLVNGNSASAAEILAAALHDNGRAQLVGRKTYGKGTVQTIIPLSDGEALKLTTSRYFTPAGISIQGTGITPDVVLQGDEQPAADMDAADAAPTLAHRDPQVAAALQALQTRARRVAQNLRAPAQR
ncbi:MAG: S41 family peptidase [Steroidobacteraceae bacterium]